jgi:hypothetical protein
MDLVTRRKSGCLLADGSNCSRRCCCTVRVPSSSSNPSLTLSHSQSIALFLNFLLLKGHPRQSRRVL